MLIILGSVEDRLTAEVRQQLVAAGTSVVLIGEADVFAATPFSLELNGTRRDGFLRCNGGRILLDEIAGVLFRLPRIWWPSTEFDLQDQVFVYHETAASWFSLLSGLSCPQINRFGLGWWVHDCCYPEQLRHSMAERLGLAIAEAGAIPARPVRVFPTPVREAEESRHVYLIGDTIVPRTTKDRDIAARLASRKTALAHWQQEYGISFCRLDFTQNETIELVYVEPMPMLDEERSDVVREVAEDLARRLL